MTLAVSTSSPRVALAWFESGALVHQAFAEAPRGASGAVLTLIQAEAQRGGGLQDVTQFVVDRGPGSFTGVKVGVTMAKLWATALGKPLFAVTAFDLIDPECPVAIPYKRGAWAVRLPGHPPTESLVRPEGAKGYGLESGLNHLPDWGRLVGRFEHLVPVDPLALVPLYVAEPSISQPKQPYPIWPA